MKRNTGAFTLVELLVSTAILALLMVVLLQMTGQTSASWKAGAAKAEQFQQSRRAFETMTRRLSSATMNTYWDYAIDLTNTDGSVVPTNYVRQSDLRFRVVRMAEDHIPLGANASYRPTHGVFFQSHIGIVDDEVNLGNLDDLLNSWGYFLEVSNSSADVPTFLGANYANRYRSRLMEFRQPAEQFSLYATLNTALKNQLTSSNPLVQRFPYRDPQQPPNPMGPAPASDDDWFVKPINSSTSRPVRTLAENVVALILLPRLSAADEQARRMQTNPTIPSNQQMLSPQFSYHSKQLSNYPTIPATIDPAINPKNQMPPIVQVVMFAIDEMSAQKLADANKGAPNLGLPALFVDANSGKTLFTSAADLESNTYDPGGDLALFEKNLIAQHLTYRFFSSNVAIRGAKWSRAETK